MIRLIDLPITARELAVKNQIAQGNKRDVTKRVVEDRKEGNFNWKETPQGRGFWMDAETGHFSMILRYELDENGKYNNSL